MRLNGCMRYFRGYTLPSVSIVMDTTTRIILSILVVLAGLIAGLLVRRWLVRRLKQTVLDGWLIQTFGFIIVLIPLFIAAGASTGIATNGFDLLKSIGGRVGEFLQVENPYEFARNTFWSLVIIILSIGVARTFSKLTRRGIAEHRIDPNIRVLIRRASYLIVVVVAIFSVLAVWQVGIALPVAALGTLTVALSLSVQGIVKDLVAGVYILLEHPFFIGDQIKVGDYTGKVVGVELRATRLRLVSGEEVTIPNEMVFGGVVINNSRYTERRATVTMTVPLEDFSRDESPERIMSCVREQAEVIPKPEPCVTVSGITGERVELTVRFWITNGQLATVTDVVYALRTLFPSADLSVKETAGDV